MMSVDIWVAPKSCVCVFVYAQDEAIQETK